MPADWWTAEKEMKGSFLSTAAAWPALVYWIKLCATWMNSARLPAIRHNRGSSIDLDRYIIRWRFNTIIMTSTCTQSWKGGRTWHHKQNGAKGGWMECLICLFVFLNFTDHAIIWIVSEGSIDGVYELVLVLLKICSTTIVQLWCFVQAWLGKKIVQAVHFCGIHWSRCRLEDKWKAPIPFPKV